LADAVVGELSAVVARLRSRTDELRWAAPESWHITLQFLGETGADAYRSLREGLAGVRAAPVPVRFGGLLAFPGAFVIEVVASAELLTLAQKVTAATERCGFAPEKRAYHPHITLARTKAHGRGPGMDALRARIGKPPQLRGFTAREFLLYESFLGPGGSKYEVRERIALRTGERQAGE